MSSFIKRLFRRNTIFFIAAALLLKTVTAFGSVVELNTGRIVAGLITERSDELIKIDTGYGIAVTYYFDEIKLIDNQPVEPVPVEETAVESLTPLKDKVEPSTSTPLKDAVVDEAMKEIEKAKESVEVKTAEVPEIIELPKAPEPEASIEIKVTEKKKEPRGVLPDDDVATLEGIDLFKKQPSPAAIKPKEAPKQRIIVDTNKPKEPQFPVKITKPKPADPAPVEALPNSDPKLKTSISDKIARYFRSYKSEFKETVATIRYKLPHVKERLYAVPVKARRNVLILTASFLAILYILICFPLMKIAGILGRRYNWLIFIPFVQVVYFIYMAKRPYWLSVFFFIPILNVFVPFILFFNILRLLKKPLWLITFMMIPGVNVFTLWYLALSKANQLSQ